MGHAPARLTPVNHAGLKAAETLFKNLSVPAASLAANAHFMQGLYAIAAVLQQLENIMDNNKSLDVGWQHCAVPECCLSHC